MSLACLVCHKVESPSRSFRSYSVSSSDNQGTCSAIAACLSRKHSIPPPRTNTVTPSSKVTPHADVGTPRLVRCRAVRRDQVRDWNLDVIDLLHA
ncbi:hypothetical protein RND81_06G051400 [Saponaria officinalis]|uniref:Uncharacterized protein n=1 Tax=Saponaria officinalis TaxID=3572 RepID=A0AAW1K836_SAPOF